MADGLSTIWRRRSSRFLVQSRNRLGDSISHRLATCDEHGLDACGRCRSTEHRSSRCAPHPRLALHRATAGRALRSLDAQQGRARGSSIISGCVSSGAVPCARALGPSPPRLSRTAAREGLHARRTMHGIRALAAAAALLGEPARI